MRILHMKLAEPSLFEAFESLIGPNGIGLIDEVFVSVLQADLNSDEGEIDFTVDEISHYVLAFTPQMPRERKRNGFGFNSLSLGTRRILRIIAALVFDRGAVMLVEHPEDGIHAGLTKKIMGLLRDYADPRQIFLASHSLTVFNTLALEDVRFVTMVDGETKVRALTDPEAEAARKYLSEAGDMADLIQSLGE